MKTLNYKVNKAGPEEFAGNGMDRVIGAACYPRFGSPYPLQCSLDRGGMPREGGQVRVSWNEAGIHVSAELEDSFIIAGNRQDEQLHYEYGDVFELFLKPRDEAYYWEMYATPRGNKSTLFFPRDRTGLNLTDFLHGHDYRGLQVSVEETPIGWNALMFVPAEQLTALGAGWGDGSAWTILCSRYNYASETLTDPEISMVPALSRENHHLVDEYARLELG